MGGADTLARPGDDIYAVDDAGDNIRGGARLDRAVLPTVADGAQANTWLTCPSPPTGTSGVFRAPPPTFAGPTRTGSPSDLYIKNLETAGGHAHVLRFRRHTGERQQFRRGSLRRRALRGVQRHGVELSIGRHERRERCLRQGPPDRGGGAGVDFFGWRQGDSFNFNGSISADGRYVAFESFASNLVAGDTSFTSDVFVKDLATGAVVRVSTGSGNDPALSADGSHVAFEAFTGLSTAVFVKDLDSGAVVAASTTSDGTLVTGYGSINPAISADGRYVAFESYDSLFVAGDTNGTSDIFVKDLATGAVVRASIASDGAQANAGSGNASISADGRYVAFESFASNLVAGDANGQKDIFVKDLLTGTVTRVSSDSGGTQSNDFSYNPALSPDGGRVAFGSSASNLVTGDTNGQQDVFVAAIPAGDAGGTDEVRSSLSYTLPGDFENLTLTGSGDIAGTGNDLANLLTGNGAANTLSGLQGNDTLNGGTGIDILDGGTELDTADYRSAPGAANVDLLLGTAQATAGGSATRWSWSRM